MTETQPPRTPTSPRKRGEREPGDGLAQEVLERLPARDPEALGLFYDAYFDRIYGYVRRMVGEEHLAEDLTQEVFLHIHRNFGTYDPTRELRPWVFTIATNKVRDYWRSRKHQTRVREQALDEEERPGVARSRERTPVGNLQNSELGARIAAAVQALPDSMRTTLILRYFEGLSFEDIGRIVDRNETAVRKRYSRALEELRKALGDELDPRTGAAP